MKKIAILLLLSMALALSVYAYNAPKTAAEFVSGASLQHEDEAALRRNGTLQIQITDSDLDSISSDGKVYYYSGRDLLEMPIPENVFDVVADYVTGEEPDAVTGWLLWLFFNPERIKAVQLMDKTIYGGICNSEGTDISRVSGTKPLIAAIQTESTALYAEYLRQKQEADKQLLWHEYENMSSDGKTSGIAAAASPFTFNNIKDSELLRWPFTETDPSDDNWYRTKIRIDFGPSDISIGGEEGILHPCIKGPIYYVNPEYTGPKFDIVGAMKRSEGELRFGSVYFTGDDYFDNQAEIIEAGIVCYPTDLLDDKVLTLETEGAITIPATGYYDNSKEGELVYTGVLTGLESAPDMLITAKSYIRYIEKDGQEKVVYSDPIARSLNTVDSVSMK